MHSRQHITASPDFSSQILAEKKIIVQRSYADIGQGSSKDIKKKRVPIGKG